MIQVPAEIFSLSDEAVVLVRCGRLCYANSRASELLGEDCVGKSTGSIFGSAFAECQAPSFVSDISIDVRSYTASLTHSGDTQVIFIQSIKPASEYIGERFWTAMREGLMNMGLSLELWRDRAEKCSDEAMLRSISAMTRSYYQMSRMVSNVSYVLDFESCSQEPVSAVVDMSSLCSELCESLGHIFRSGSTAFHFNGAEGITVCSDRAMIFTALLNLLSNCILHAKGCSSIGISLSCTAESVIISVSDDGCGIEPSRLRGVFSCYQQRSGLQGGGAGFGLTVVRRIAQKLGGTLLLESRPGKGTTVRVSLLKNLGSSLCCSKTGYSSSMRPLFVGLADCLPQEAFSETYMD